MARACAIFSRQSARNSPPLWPSRPVNLYRITQGAHVISGVASIPLLIAKLWTVYPKLFERPAVKSVLHALERISILVLAGAAFFELASGTFNAAQNYPWSFFFTTAHYAVAWIAFGSLLVHIAVKLPIIRESLTREKRREIEQAFADLDRLMATQPMLADLIDHPARKRMRG